MTNFRKLSNGCFQINYGEPLYKLISKLKYFPNPLDITQQSGTQSISCCMWCVTRSELVNFGKFSMSQEVKKGPFAALIIESSLQVFLTYFQKPTWFYLLITKDSLMGKVWGKTFSDAKCPGPLLQRSLLKKWGETRDVVVKPLPVCFTTEQSTVKASLFVH